jgi:mRNA-degrading endonuclease RelE of RelBE toxin-antitoxin system
MVEPETLPTLVETSTFARRRPGVLDDESYRLAQLALASNPELGARIPGGGGIRKIRWDVGGRGKRGGARIIYYWAVGPQLILLLFIYGKSERDDLSEKQLRKLSKLVKEEFR